MMSRQLAFPEQSRRLLLPQSNTPALFCLERICKNEESAEYWLGRVKDVCMRMRVTPQAVFAASFAVRGADSGKAGEVKR